MSGSMGPISTVFVSFNLVFDWIPLFSSIFHRQWGQSKFGFFWTDFNGVWLIELGFRLSHNFYLSLPGSVFLSPVLQARFRWSLAHSTEFTIFFLQFLDPFPPPGGAFIFRVKCVRFQRNLFLLTQLTIHFKFSGACATPLVCGAVGRGSVQRLIRKEVYQKYSTQHDQCMLPKSGVTNLRQFERFIF